MEDIKLIESLINSEDEAFYRMDEIPQKLLIILLRIAIEKIDSLENHNEFDERDLFDMQTDYEYVFLDLLKLLRDLLESGMCDLWKTICM